MGTISKINQNKKVEAAGLKEGQGATFYFAGFKGDFFTAIPNEVFDVLMPILGEAELKVLMYIYRRTIGFGKNFDAISLEQFTDGIRRKDGSILDNGTGLSRPSVLKGIALLLEKELIWTEKRYGENGKSQVTIYGVRLAEDRNATFKADFANQKTYSMSEYSSKNYDENAANPVFQRGKESLPHHHNRSKEILPLTVDRGKKLLPLEANIGKESLIEGVKIVAKESKNSLPNGVKNLNPQHESKQNNSKQEIDNNKQAVPATVIAPVQVDTLARQIDAVADDYSEVEKELLRFGLPKQTVAKLISQYSAEYLLEKVELVEKRLREDVIKNPPGFLLRAIENDFQPLNTPLLEKSRKFPAVEALLAERLKENEELMEFAKTLPPIRKTNDTSSVAPSVSEPPLVGAASTEGYFPQPVYSDAQLSRPSNYSPILDNAVLEDMLEGATEQGGRNFSSDEVLGAVLDDLRLRLGCPELVVHLQGACLYIQEGPEGFTIAIHLSENWRWKFIGQEGRGAIKIALGWKLGGVCAVAFGG